MENEQKGWYAVKVFFNRVSRYKNDIISLGQEVYMPMRIDRKVVEGEVVRSLKPLIPSTLFVYCTPSWLINYRYEHWGYVMYYSDTGRFDPGRIDDHEMEMFRMVTSKGDDSQVEYIGKDRPEYHRGDKVRILDGMYKGAEGYIKRIRKDRKLLVSVKGVAVVAIAGIHTSKLEKVV